MIAFWIQGHDLVYDVQTGIQIFYPNRRYQQVEEPQREGITIRCQWEDGKAVASFYQDGDLCEEYVEEGQKECKRAVKDAIFRLLQKHTGQSPPWGSLTGVRPAKVANELMAQGMDPKTATAYLITEYDANPKKVALCVEVAQAEQRLLSKSSPKAISLYIGIPFCPTRCLYCSFSAYPLSQYQSSVAPYLAALEQELSFLGEYTQGKEIESIYIGGGTPTSLTADELRRLLSQIRDRFPMQGVREFTVEAGRPDTITEEKLRVLLEYGVDRISINPQTMQDKTLECIGRKHTAEDIRTAFAKARDAGHKNINMDLIVGLPGEGEKEMESTLRDIQRLMPESLTVHTLAIKRASRLKEQLADFAMTEAKSMERMLSLCEAYTADMGMHPYYMYRQKNMLGNFENVGYAMPGHESLYNVQIMEERQTILAAGAGGSTKVFFPKENRIERIWNVKGVTEYILRIDEMIERKRRGLPG